MGEKSLKLNDIVSGLFLSSIITEPIQQFTNWTGQSHEPTLLLVKKVF